MITINETHPDVVAYNASRRDLSDGGATLSKKKKELSDVTRRFMGQKAAPRSKIDREANEILTGMGHSADWISAEKVEELTREVEVWERVVQRQRDTVGKLRTRYSAAICQQKDLQERYIAIQRKMARHCAGLAEANAEEVEFFDELNAVGAVPCFRPMRVSAVGLASDPNSVATFHRREVETYCPQALA